MLLPKNKNLWTTRSEFINTWLIEDPYGFGTNELIAFLYAHSFPRSKWNARVNEAFDGAEGL